MLECFGLRLPDQDGWLWITQAADVSTSDPDPDPGESFVCVHPSFSGYGRASLADRLPH